jgi:hypothetical protein
MQENTVKTPGVATWRRWLRNRHAPGIRDT